MRNDNARFASEAERWRGRRSELRRRWQLPEEACVFVFSGKLIPKKRPLDAIAAIDAIATSANVALLLVGDGELRARCEQAARSLSRGRVRFTGFLNQSQIPQAYAAADVLVMPSGRGETWGLSVNEAMACGLPAVTSDRVGCAPDLVLPGRTGYVVRTGDVEELALAMLATAHHASDRRRMGREARQHVKSYDITCAVRGVIRAVGLLTDSRSEWKHVYRNVA